ncbi:hypothetical protein Hanom_Chr14g01275751 [Helianthus anomalus]
MSCHTETSFHVEEYLSPDQVGIQTDISVECRLSAKINSRVVLNSNLSLEFA